MKKLILLLLLTSQVAFAAAKIQDADIKANAAIALTKLAASTAHNAATFNSSGFLAGGVAPGSSGNILTSDGTDWTSASTTAALSVGALDAQAANATGLALVSNVLSAQSADATHPGVVNNTTQTLAGAKTFSSLVTGQASFAANNGTATTPSFYTSTGGGNTGFYFGGSGATFAYNTADIAAFALTQWKMNVATNLFVNSAAATPALYLLGESTSGLYRIGANNLGFSISSTKILDIASTGLSVTGALSATGAVTGSNLSGTNTGDQTITLTGDVTGTGTGSFATTIGAGKVTNSMLSAENANSCSALTTCTNARTIDWSTAPCFTLTLTSGNACTLTFSNPTAGQSKQIWLTNGSAGGTATVVWPTAKWFPAGAPTMTTGTAALDVCTCTYNGTSYACNCLQNGG